MADHTLKKISDWLKFQEEVYGSFRLPPSKDGRPEPDAVQDFIDLPGEHAAEHAEQHSGELAAEHSGEEAGEHASEQTAEHITAPAETVSRKPSASGIVEEESTPHDLYADLQRITDIDELKRYCLQAGILRTDLEGTNLVFGVGNAEADLLLIGEAPGEQEDRQGEPFVGKAGQLLNKILKAIGFDRDQVYIANILKHRPPNNRDPLPEERVKSLPFLEKQIDLINPKLILCLGRVSAQTLLETTAPMKELRVRFHRYRDKYELLVTYHPAALLRNPNWKRDTWEDVQLLRKRYDELGGRP
ncbi:MAG: uracil-DNA glycosylase [Balneolaceae bacterium]|nr:MAG: uracil-DNA glycosylase [Balneolaceae bacterium]